MPASASDGNVPNRNGAMEDDPRCFKPPSASPSQLRRWIALRKASSASCDPPLGFRPPPDPDLQPLSAGEPLTLVRLFNPLFKGLQDIYSTVLVESDPEFFLIY
ncbi:hypothetical protein DSO57_1030570 [Entomophthora muscae]|uniref:Uncharacterized protein n=1 Tax=Entomophthora muscae TaxID=34485 RepID=A0ACC2ULR1_9FUNG|nr:hypothetical protein DSO57_1030570 [Entomophthora muscae]